VLLLGLTGCSAGGVDGSGLTFAAPLTESSQAPPASARGLAADDACPPAVTDCR
jgi:hypothetical protein